MTDVGKNIFDARKRLGMTQEELAEKVGYKSKSAINKAGGLFVLTYIMVAQVH